MQWWKKICLFKKYFLQKYLYCLQRYSKKAINVQWKIQNNLHSKYPKVTKIESKYFTFLNTFNYKFKGIDNGPPTVVT